ncbi:hypothetical protein E4U58_006971, partial [Claviceps cyperi]
MAQLTMNAGNKNRGFGAAGVVELVHLVRHIAVAITVLGPGHWPASTSPVLADDFVRDELSAARLL